MNLKKQFTLLITTYNRYPYLLRLLKYYQSYNFPFTIHILDSSSDEMNSDELSKILKNNKIYYHKYDPKIFISKKIGKGTGFINTPYAAICADDDFIVPNGIIESINFLESNSDYSLAHGRYITHYINQKNNEFDWYPAYINDYSLEIKNPIDRINYHLSNYTSTFYAVHRSEILKRIWQEAARYTSDWGLSEIFPSALSILYGKKKLLNVFYSSREHNMFSWHNKDYFQNMYSNEKCKRAIKGISIHISALTGIKENICETIAEKSLNMYLHSCSAYRIRYQRRIRKNIVSILEKFHIKKYILYIRKRFNNIRKKIILKSFHKEYALIINDKSESINDFQKIKELVLYYQLGSNRLNRSRKNYMEFDSDNVNNNKY